MSHPKAKSPYQRYQKSPFRYSDIFRDWMAATIVGRVGEATTLGDKHTRAFGGEEAMTNRRGRKARVEVEEASA